MSGSRMQEQLQQAQNSFQNAPVVQNYSQKIITVISNDRKEYQVPFDITRMCRAILVNVTRTTDQRLILYTDIGNL